MAISQPWDYSYVGSLRVGQGGRAGRWAAGVGRAGRWAAGVGTWIISLQQRPLPVQTCHVTEKMPLHL
ncbi:hypothetical protein TYRP_018406 [Tyrophagus putrescentiae]|nr:hypothetical protein TYRP_018406 [Tyrophagus putrescentiae]